MIVRSQVNGHSLNSAQFIIILVSIMINGPEPQYSLETVTRSKKNSEIIVQCKTKPWTAPHLQSVGLWIDKLIFPGESTFFTMTLTESDLHTILMT